MTLIKTRIWNLIIAAGITLVSNASAQDTGNVIPFQRQLADQSGQPLTPAFPVTVVFRLYQAPVGRVALWEEAQPNISVNADRFSVLLGSRTGLPGPTNFNLTLYLGLTVDDGEPATADVEMCPRQAIVLVINSVFARNAEKLQCFDWNSLSNDPSLLAGAIPGSQIANRSINSVQIEVLMDLTPQGKVEWPAIKGGTVGHSVDSYHLDEFKNQTHFYNSHTALGAQESGGDAMLLPDKINKQYRR